MLLSLTERFRTFAAFLKTDDKPAGWDLLKLMETSPYRESDELGFSISQISLFLWIILLHQKMLIELERLFHEKTAQSSQSAS